VLVSKVDDRTLHSTPIHVGDTIIGVFSGDDFKESTTGLDYADTKDCIDRAIRHSIDRQRNGIITLELNRIVKRATVQVIVEDDHGKTTELEALAGDNLRLLLMHHNTTLYAENTPRLDQPHLAGNCGGEGICGTCLVAVRYVTANPDNSSFLLFFLTHILVC
jgi:ferredoxin